MTNVLLSFFFPLVFTPHRPRTRQMSCLVMLGLRGGRIARAGVAVGQGIDVLCVCAYACARGVRVRVRVRALVCRCLARSRCSLRQPSRLSGNSTPICRQMRCFRPPLILLE